MCGGKQHVTSFGIDERAGGLASAGRDARHVAVRHVHQIDLIEGIARLALALEYELPAVFRPIPLAGASSFDGETTNPGEEVTLGSWALRLETRKQTGPDHGRREQTNKHQRRTSKRSGHRYP